MFWFEALQCVLFTTLQLCFLVIGGSGVRNSQQKDCWSSLHISWSDVAELVLKFEAIIAELNIQPCAAGDKTVVLQQLQTGLLRKLQGSLREKPRAHSLLAFLNGKSREPCSSEWLYMFLFAHELRKNSVRKAPVEQRKFAFLSFCMFYERTGNFP